MGHRLVVMVMCAACSSSTSSTSSTDCDLSTDSGVDAAYKKATGKELPKNNRCVDRSQTFPNVARIGMFADDRGCIPQGLLVGCEMNPPKFDATALAAAGWAKADLAKRQKLAEAWLSEIEGYTMVGSKPPRFPKDFAPPAAHADGPNTVLEFWTVEPAGMEPVMRYHKSRVVFTADGTSDKAEELDKAEIRSANAE
jgi:hypothetical protein